MTISSGEIQPILNQIRNNQKDVGYQRQILNNYQQLVDILKKENSAIHSTYYDNVTRNSADGQQSKYVFQSSSILNTLYNYGFWVYMILAIILCVVIVRKTFKVYEKVLLVLAILTYPFYIYPLEELSYVVSVYLWDLVISVAYNTGHGNTSLEYGLSPNAGGDTSVSQTKDVAMDEKVDSGKKEVTPAPTLFIPRTLPPKPTATLSTLSFEATDTTFSAGSGSSGPAGPANSLADSNTISLAQSYEAAWTVAPSNPPKINGPTPIPDVTPYQGPAGTTSPGSSVEPTTPAPPEHTVAP